MALEAHVWRTCHLLLFSLCRGSLTNPANMRVRFQLIDLWEHIQIIAVTDIDAYRNRVWSKSSHQEGTKLGPAAKLTMLLAVSAVVVYSASTSTQRSVFSWRFTQNHVPRRPSIWLSRFCVNGMCLGCVCDVYGLYTWCTWDIYMMYMGYTHDVHGIYTWCTWDIHMIYLSAVHSTLIYLVCERSRKRQIPGTGKEHLLSLSGQMRLHKESGRWPPGLRVTASFPVA